jgi:polar amino acid transport system substrate-binding protein
LGVPLHFHLRRRLAALLFGGALLAGCASSPPAGQPTADGSAASTEVRQVLAPNGVLRIAVYPGSPTSLVVRAGQEACGLTVDLGRAAAQRLGVAARLMQFERVEQVIDAVRTGQADMTVTNATLARASLVDFTAPLVALELGYLVLPGSPVGSIADIDRAGIKVGVSQGSSSQATLGRVYRQARLVPAASLQVAAEMLDDHRIDVFATNKGILFQMADGLANARVLEGRWGIESLAIAVPKGRERGKPWLDEFAASAREQGLVQRAAQCAGLRGLAEAEPAR